MGIVITIRDSDQFSYFQELSMELLRVTNPEVVLISSGFFQEHDHHPLPTTTEYNFSQDKDSHGNSLVDLLPGKQVILVGHRSSNDQSFFNLKENLIDALGAANIKTFIHKHRKWHAKIMLMRKTIDQELHTVACIVGSSNCTLPAFGDIHSLGFRGNGFNMEADTFIFANEFDLQMREAVSCIRDRTALGGQIIQSPYDPDMNGGLLPMQLMDQIYEKLVVQLRNPHIFEELF